MRRADRLFLLIQALRGRRVVPAHRLAETLDVSLRTIYRDVRDLQLSGVPIEGEAGVGYMLPKGADIPPLMFDPEELEALLVGARFVEAFASEPLGQAARRALIKIDAVVPPTLRARGERSRVFAPVTPRWARERSLMGELHRACMSRSVVRLDYAREDAVRSEREVEPLCLMFWGQAWTLGAWCRMRGDFRNFRIDRIHTLHPTGETLPEHSERNLDAYLRAVCDAP